MKSRELQRQYWDWLSSAERLLRSLAEQTAALTLRDVKRVEQIQPELDHMMERLQVIDKSTVAATITLAETMDVEPSLRGILAALTPAEAQQVETLTKRVKTVSFNLRERLDRNRKLLASELDYVHGTMAIIAKVAQEQSQYHAVVAGPMLMDQVA